MSFMGGSSAKIPNRKPKPLGVDEDRFSTNEQAKPVPYFAGKQRLACNFISDIFDVHKVGANKDLGKKPARSGTSYYASYACLIAHGPLDVIDAVLLNGEQVWPDTDIGTLPNSLVRDGSNPIFVDLTIPDYGLIRFYWGTEDQEPDDYLIIQSGVTHPAYRGMAYFVAHQMFLGFNQTNVQNVEVIASRYPPLGLSPINVGQDANPANVLYELLTNPRFGRAISSSLIDADAIEELGAQLAAEGIGLSPLLNTQKDAISWIIQLLEYFDGYPRISTAGLLSFGSVRPSDSMVGGVDESLMIEPLRVNPEDWSTTFSETNVKFSNPNQNYDPDARTWRDRGNFQITGQLNTQTIERLWVTNPGLAQFMAAGIGRTSSLPDVSGEVTLRYNSLFDSLSPGGLIEIAYPPRNYTGLLCRITEITVPDPGKPQYRVAWKLDRSYLLADLTVESFLPASVDEDADPEQITAMRLIELPVGLCPEGKLSLAVLAARPDEDTTSYQVHLGKNYDFTGEITAESYDIIDSHTRFAWHGNLMENYPSTTSTIDDVTGIAIRLDGPDVELPEMTQFDALADELLVFVNNELFSVIEARVIGINEYRLFVIRERFASTRAAHLENDDAFILSLSDLRPLQHAQFDPNNSAIVKVQASTGRGSAALEDQTELDVAITGRIYQEPPLASLAVGGNAINPTYSAGASIAITWTLTDGGELPWRPDLRPVLIVLDFYNAAGSILLGSTTTPGPSLNLTNAELQVLLGGSEVSFLLKARKRTIADWWEIDTANITLNVTKV